MPPKKILLAEDDPDDRDFFCEFLRGRPDVQLLPAIENGVELFNYLENVPDGGHPDAIILDQNMPKQNGLQTLKRLKENEAYAAIPVMIYSTFADDLMVKSSTQHGAALVRPKPFTAEGYNEMMDEFFRVIEETKDVKRQ